MKSMLLLAVGAMAAALMSAGCANQPANASTNPADRTYTSGDLNNTGRHDTAGAIQAIDPSVRVSGGR